MRFADVLQEYFTASKRKTWEYTFRKKPGSKWAVSEKTRIARTSAESRGSILLFTIGAKAKCRPCGLQEEIVAIIQRNGLRVVRESTTAVNREAVYVGFDLSAAECTPETLRRILDQVMQAVADCSQQIGRLL